MNTTIPTFANFNITDTLNVADTLAEETKVYLTPDEWADLYVSHHLRVFNMARKITHSYDDAWDIVQDTFEAIYHAWPKRNQDAPIDKWISTIGFNKAMDFIRRRTVQQSVINELDAEKIDIDHNRAVIARELNIEEQLITTELINAIEQSIMLLSPAEREVIELAIKHQFTPEAISRITGKSLRNVKAYIRRGKNRLFKLII